MNFSALVQRGKGLKEICNNPEGIRVAKVKLWLVLAKSEEACDERLEVGDRAVRKQQ